jgi:hypothetical protein
MRAWGLCVLVGGFSSAFGCDLDKRELGDESATGCRGERCSDAGEPGASAGTAGAAGSGAGSGGASSTPPLPGAGGSGAGGAGGAGAASGAGGTSAPEPEPPLNPCALELLQNPSFESGVAPWSEFYPGEDPVIYSEALSADQGTLAHGDGEYLAWFGGVADETTRVSQRVTVPDGTLALVVSGYRRFLSRTSQAGDFADRMTIRLVRGLDVVAELFEWGNQDASAEAEWEFFSQRIDAAPYLGVELTLQLESSTGPTPESNFFFDDLSLIAECTP